MSENRLAENITINAHSSIKIQASKILYFDPFQVVEESQDADVVFITHEHFDHFDPKSIAKVKKQETILVAPKSMQKKVLAESGMAADKCIFVQPTDKNEIAGLSVEMVAAYNKLKPFHPKRNQWVGYLVSMDGITYYVTGDTDVTQEMKAVACDVLLIPIGGGYTMDKKAAAEYVIAAKPKVAIPTHYGEIVGKKEDGADFKELVEKAGCGVQVELKL